MTTELLVTIAGIAVLLLLSALFSGSETSLTAASRARMHTLEREGYKRAHQVNWLLERKERLIGAILLGNNLVNILASALATSVLIQLFGDSGVLYATLVMTLLILIFSEVMPKTYAINNADRMSLAVAPVMRPLVVILAPVTGAIQAVVRLTLSLLGARNVARSARHAEEELRGAIELHEGEEARHERAMLRSILDLAEITVEEVMTHRRGVVMIDSALPPARLIKAVLASPYTRLPLYEGASDNVIGVLHVKALLRGVQALEGKPMDQLDVKALAQAAWFVPESTDLLSQLEAFRARHEHMAIVVDEYGEMLGIVTLEDILEEIVGEIADEHDIEIDGVSVLPDRTVVTEGTVTIRDLNRRFEWDLPDEEASTIAGLVLHEARSIPQVGQTFTFHGFQFEILGRQRNRITSIKLTPPDSEEPDLPAPEEAQEERREIAEARESEQGAESEPEPTRAETSETTTQA